jgi:hypothetical protein
MKWIIKHSDKNNALIIYIINNCKCKKQRGGGEAEGEGEKGGEGEEEEKKYRLSHLS